MSKVDEFAEKFAQSLKVTPASLDRLITEPCGLTPEEMMTALAHPLVGKAGIDLMADFMHPTDSRYFDAIYGSNYGQRDIRGWLVPMMSEISFIEFVPTSTSSTLKICESHHPRHSMICPLVERV